MDIGMFLPSGVLALGFKGLYSVLNLILYVIEVWIKHEAILNSFILKFN
jgi:hypothetical protein